MQTLTSHLTLLRQLIVSRISAQVSDEEADPILGNRNIFFEVAEDNTAYSHFHLVHELRYEEYILLLLALVPHLQPNYFDGIIQQLFPQGGDFPEIGGVKGTNHRGMLPTGETAQFVIAGNDFKSRLYVQQLLTGESALLKKGLLHLEPVRDGEPIMSGRLVLAQEAIERMLFGKETPPRFSPEFPAKRIATSMHWQDLVLHPQTMDQVNDIRTWLEYNAQLEADASLARKLRPGYRVLFYGPPGTGKTLTASLLGEEFKKDVYKIDLSQVVSKYIGETEKNLEKVFSKAENKDWILFFDEADALFGKRTNVQSSHDRYANQEVSYLLQRVENYRGLLILASNFKGNLDEAFVRRFNAIVHFPAPNAIERLDLWYKAMPDSIPLDEDVSLEEIAERFELTGASIINIVHYASLRALSRPQVAINSNDLITGIKKEFRKEDKGIL
jgi:ATPase family associated with various cellular activities (AAA)